MAEQETRNIAASPKRFDAFDFEMMQAQITALAQAVNELRAASGQPAIQLPRPVSRLGA